MGKTMAQIRIKTKAGEVSIDFTDNKDLETQLNKIDFKELESIVSKNVPNASIINSTIIEEFKDLYTIDSAGNLNLIKIPKQKTDAIKLAIFLANRGLKTSEIKTITGVAAPKSYMNQKDFIKTGDSFSLQADARKEVLEKIIPKIRQK